MVNHTVHIVTTLRETRGSEIHAAELLSALSRIGVPVSLWSDRAGPFVASYGAQNINPFAGQMPRGGTLILLGTWLAIDPWIDYAKPSRLILICNTSNKEQLDRMLMRLERPTLPPIEMVYVSSRLREAMGVPGRLCPTIVDTQRFKPASRQAGPVSVGRLSADRPEKHHPDDASLYRLLAWNQVKVRLMGASCLTEVLAETPYVECKPAGAESSESFLQSLDIFFYRTRQDWYEPSGRVIMEALACGIPIVAHINGGYTDWIRHGENGFLFSSQEEAWEWISKLRVSQELRQRLGAAACATAQTLATPSCIFVQEYLAWLRN